MHKKDIRIWYNTKSGEVVDCKYHYDCDKISKKILDEGKMNFFRNGWCRLGLYNQSGKIIGIAEAYDAKNLKKAIQYLTGTYKIDTMITETHNPNGYNMEIFPNPISENMNGI